MDRGDLCGAQRALDIEGCIRRIVDHVDILVAQLTHDAMNTRALHTHTSAHRVDAVIIRLHGHLRPLTRDACDALDRDQAIVDLRYLQLKEALQEHLIRTREDDLRVVVQVIHPQDDRTYGISLAIVIRRDLLRFRQQQLVALVIQQQHLLLPYLIHLSGNDMIDLVLIFSVKTIFLQLKYLRGQCLTQVQDRTTAEICKMHLIGHLFTHLTVRINRACLRQGQLQVRILQFVISYDLTVSPDLEITLLRVDDHIVILIRAKHLGDHVTERIFQNVNHRLFVDIFQFLELSKRIDHADCFRFLGHNLT